MDSKLVRMGILIVSLFAVTVMVIVLAVNGKFSQKKVQPTEDIYEPVDETVEETPADLYAWLSDETFFDAEKLADGKYEVKETQSATYMVSSIDKDIRIVVMDDNGDIISGRRFRADISDLGEYSDENRDGIIYIEDVSPGDYSISMKDLMGYTFPTQPVKISVSAKIEYKAVADISYLIKTEADIDAEKEDTAVNDAGEETAGNSAVRTVEGATFGIDVSKYNGDINWEQVKNEGVGFAIIRCGYRGSKTGAIVEDPYFRKNIEGATSVGMPIGVYFFTQAVDEREAVEEASAVMSLIKDYKLTFPVFVDSESAGGKGRADDLEVTQRSKVLQAFCETIRSGGYKAGIYASKNWFNKRLDVSKLSADNVTWLAEYAEKTSYGGTYQLWQYSSAGRIPGIEGRVDMDLSYLDVGQGSNKRTTSKENQEDGQDNSRDM
ncbi:MAG: glycoside hydrolase family 25 protein [Lachnospiraceae bacterium]|nr:glycoside hydrolase family 25 protein [Lachnospiraceae bacterium]